MDSPSLARRATGETHGHGEYSLAYFITWTTYGTWLPGDERGWRARGSSVIREPDEELQWAAESAMTEHPVTLSQEQRDLVDAVIVKHCAIRKWTLHARNARSNHIHVVVTAAIDGEEARAQFKAWCSRGLSEQVGLVGRTKNGQCRWFSEKGDVQWIEDDGHLENAIRYVNELQ